MKSFKNLFEDAMGVRTKEKKDTDDEVKDFKPRSKGEEDFADQHKGQKPIDHPVATDAQYSGGKTAAKGETGEDHDGHDKKGEKPVKTYSDFKKYDMSGKGNALQTVGGGKGEKAIVKQGSSKVSEEYIEIEEAKGNAPTRFNFHLKNAQSSLKDIDKAIKDYEKAFKKKDGISDWGAVGSMNHLANQLGEIADSLLQRGEYMVREEVEFIEEGQGVYRKGDKVGGGHKLSQEEANVLDMARKGLNPQNAKQFDSEVMKSKDSFESILNFAKASA